MNAEEHSRALERVLFLMQLDPPAESPEGRELRVLAEEVEAYERAVYPLDASVYAAHAACLRMLRLMLELADFYSLRAACAWCEDSQPMLGGKRPLDLIVTEAGAADVFAVVARLRDGVYV